ncbi:uncharacterized protein EDB93DRAFT_1145541 [Suillus bovinus]|uniref:uncharacterized protein n=1 Tax=Suillus bovinus TaxID=48563 RepID=UPI001B8722A6|nr:uncharacterized protein EDB93DRAFT_1145541 [Suillus bovinus]KAG2147826.1 hypothetical protein EDB93DRAFT_1145541 [Suillus bovinus]
MRTKGLSKRLAAAAALWCLVAAPPGCALPKDAIALVPRSEISIPRILCQRSNLSVSGGWWRTPISRGCELRAFPAFARFIKLPGVVVRVRAAAGPKVGPHCLIQ